MSNSKVKILGRHIDPDLAKIREIDSVEKNLAIEPSKDLEHAINLLGEYRDIILSGMCPNITRKLAEYTRSNK